MKFTNGYWMLRDGVDALYAREAYELNINEDNESLNVLGAHFRGAWPLRYAESSDVQHRHHHSCGRRDPRDRRPLAGCDGISGIPGSTPTNRAVVNTCTPWRKAMATAKWAKTAPAFR